MSKHAKNIGASGVRRDGSIDLKNHAATMIAIFSNRMSRAASRFYRERYGIGVVEWRVLMFIGHAGTTSANRICRETDLDKGAVSRSLSVLERMGLIRVDEDSADSRRRNVTLTVKGKSLHDEIVPVALKRQRDLLSALSAEEVEILMKILRRLQARVVSLELAAKKRFPSSASRKASKQRATRVTRSQHPDGSPRRRAPERIA